MTEIERIEGLGRQRVLATLASFGTIRMAASIMGVSHTALIRWMKLSGVSRPQPVEDVHQRQRRKRKSPAALAEWLRKNPGVVLPRSTKGISRITGCTCDQIKTYLYKRRKQKRALIAKMPSLLHVPALVVDRRGRAIVTGECDNFQWYVDHWSLQVAIFLWKGDEEFIVPVPDIGKFYREVSKLARATTEDAPES